MTSRGPDLVQRAAAALRKRTDPAEKSSSGQTTLLDDTKSPAPLPLRAGEAWPAASIAPAAGNGSSRQRQINISPTLLAAQGIVLPSSGSSRVVEEFRAVKREVMANIARARQSASSGRSRMVLVTSARPEDGKTFTAINLSLALALEKDTQVLLVDADGYRQSAMKYLGISSDTGWLDVVCGNVVNPNEVIMRTNLPGLSVMPAGAERPEIPELMSSAKMSDLLDALTEEDLSRIVVVDSVPCLNSMEPAILAGLAGQTIFVVAAHKTERSEIETSLRLLNASPNVSLVLNRAHPQLTEQFKGYGYAYASKR
jgi:Mrp family chromosome partitioning ATPase